MKTISARHDALSGDAWDGIEWLLRQLKVDVDYACDRSSVVVNSKDGSMCLSIKMMPASNFVQTSKGRYVTGCENIILIEETGYDIKNIGFGIRSITKINKGWTEVIAISEDSAKFSAKALYAMLKRRYSTALPDSVNFLTT